MSKETENTGVLGKVLPPVIVALLVGGTAPWWWSAITENEASYADLYSEGESRLVRLRQNFQLCGVKEKFAVTDKISLVTIFTKDFSELDAYKNPEYVDYKFGFILSELAEEADKNARAALRASNQALDQIPDKLKQLSDYLDRYQRTSNNDGAAEYLAMSFDKLEEVVELLDELRAPWAMQIDTFQCGL